MNESRRQTLLARTQQLLDSIRDADWETYQQLCDPEMTCFEPEAGGQLVRGLKFHQFYFELGGHLGKHQSTIVSPHVRFLGDHAAVVSYVRLVQSVNEAGQPVTKRYEETRVWQDEKGKWIHMHFHRSQPN